ncbi:hypothetical protein [Bacillus pseudomycoides]|uniref:hypothetical protein n=1 Tax=Bacillus pseudomycoides TaxID=64104 RepID=UPI0001A14F8F|nr:hypothetical protein [Bacillus pseudomycoides]EEM07700.1 hypothetical protein bmyco0003_56220 [Bacillus pseudomycoides]PEF75674.1 hypothetical protein CON94_09175 [Bacillus pseudomycoides]PFZ08090.1 hypothetical protein COL63_25595 [Bacillus pseudomycoides]PGC53786.1 hypothetical protein COM14_02260 [Bacillus pseudomycoides]PGD28078.1 hypothetical protein COM30_21015 [Bacillus pseudomycoides]
MKEAKLREIGYKVLQETLILSRNVLFYPEDAIGVKYVQEITDAIHNIPDSIQNGNEKFLDFELELLKNTLSKMDFESVLVQNIKYFKLYYLEIESLLRKKYAMM